MMNIPMQDIKTLVAHTLLIMQVGCQQVGLAQKQNGFPTCFYYALSTCTVCISYTCTILSSLNARAFIFLSRGAYPAFIRDWHLLETGIY